MWSTRRCHLQSGPHDRGDFWRHLSVREQAAHVAREIQRGEQAPTSFAQVAVPNQKRHASIERLLFRLQEVETEPTIVIGRRRGAGWQVGRDTLSNGQSRPVDARLDGPELEAQHARDILEGYFGNLCKD
ncbi:MAG: hypothetical protein PVS2B1_25920 [Candidatus Dormibacteraceae bacterium]